MRDHPVAQPIVQLEQVSYRRNDSNLISDISLQIDAGSWTCIAGRNGSGKSTLVRMLNGLLPASSGRIVIDGLELNHETLWEIRKRIGIVFASPDDQFVGLTVEDDIAFGLENLCLEQAEMSELISFYARRLEISHLLHRHPASLSGGQKQRSAIAAVLAMEPSIIVFDEASSMLDERSKHGLLEIMQDLQHDGKYTLISITHDTSEMAKADRLIILSAGRIEADGTPQELLSCEDLLQRCRLTMPFPLQVCRELKRRGVDIGSYITEAEVTDALWKYHLRTCHTPIEIQEQLRSLR